MIIQKEVKMVKVYGSHACPGTMSALVKLFDADVAVDFRDVLGSHPVLKEFLKLREDPIFDEKKAQDKLGFPLFVLEDGTLTFSLEEAMGGKTGGCCG